MAALGIKPGLCAIIGSGGKTSLLLRLAGELPGRVLVCTSTRILPPPLLLLFFRHPLLMALIQFVRIFRYIALLRLFLLHLPAFFAPPCVFFLL